MRCTCLAVLLSHAPKGPLQKLWPFATAQPTERVASLDVLRGLMAMFVAIYHHAVWTQAFAFDAQLNGAITALGVYSVEGFFIISGFCFCLVYRDTRFGLGEVRSFHIKRFARIAPVYYLAVALNLLLDQRVGPFFSWTKLLENVTLTFGLVHPNHGMVLGGWSIGIEYVFYLIFPLVAVGLRSAWILGAITLALSALALPYIFEIVAREPEAERFHAYVQIPNHAFLFAWGAVLARLYARTRLRLRAGAIALSTLALFAMLLETAQTDPDHFVVMVGWPRVFYLLGCLALVALFAFAEAPPTATRSTPLARLGAQVRKLSLTLGDLSYAVYLLHPFAWLTTRVLFAKQLSAPVACAVSLTLTIALAWLVHRMLERPAMKFGKQLSARGRTAAASSPHQEPPTTDSHGARARSAARTADR